MIISLEVVSDALFHTAIRVNYRKFSIRYTCIYGISPLEWFA